MISKIIHQTAKTNLIPPEWVKFRQQAAFLHPGWEFRLWTDIDNEQLIRREIPGLVEWYVSLPKGIMRADVARCVYMYVYGGVYADLDYEFIRPFDLIGHSCVLPIEKDWMTGGSPTFGNAIFASEARHPFFKAVLDEFMAAPPVSQSADVINTTGPAFLSRLAAKRPDLTVNVTFPKRELFFPDYPKTKRDREQIISNGVAYGMHHCHGTWREWSLKTSIFRIVYRKRRVRH